MKKLEHIARELDANLSQLAIAWTLRQSNVASAIIGASRVSQVEENVKAVDLELTPDVLSEIDTVLQEIDGFVPIW